MVNDCHSPEVQPHLEDQEGQSCLGNPAHDRRNKTINIQLTGGIKKSTDSKDQFTHSFSSLSRMSRQSVFSCRSLRNTHKPLHEDAQNDKYIKKGDGTIQRGLCGGV